ncbi:MAG: hypothetical protein GF317_07420 [Candidatus Lokiarchaeota archaeon]|nr:hypothetical protein [Candidatus Lokiarchaeota archaeon]MBD3199538.1 hypothetical protein [Candidatus Lokiarchaeota archaeon]
MADVRIKSPNLDDVFDKWKQKAVRKDKKTMEKQFGTKGAVFSPDAISAAETVKETKKEAAIYFAIKKVIEPAKAKGDEELVRADKVAKETFFAFKGDVDKDNWDEDDVVPMYNTLKAEACSRCSGKGYSEEKCGSCGGSGKQQDKLIVLEGEEQDKQKKVFEYPCGNCYGTGKVRERCKECDGQKNFYKYQILPVPFKRVVTGMPVLHSSAKTKYEKEMEEDLHKLIDEVEGIKFDDFKTLDKKAEASLGYYNKDIKKTIKNAGKDYKNYEKDDDTNIITKIHLFPMIQFFCETKKGKSFEIYSIGSEQKFITYSNL